MKSSKLAGVAGMIVVLILGRAALAAPKRNSSGPAPVAAPSPVAPGPVGGAIGNFALVTAGQIAASGATDIAAALALVPTLVIEDTGGASGLVTISLRGSSGRQVLVLVDGHRVSATPGAAFNLNDLAVPVERVAMVEVTPAPASLVYGPDAIGGVVNIVTRPAAATPALGVSYGRGSEAAQRLAGGVQYGFRKVGLRLDGQWFSGDGFRDNGDYDSKSFVLGAAVEPAPWGLEVRWTVLNREAGVPGPVALPSPAARQKDAHDGLRADVLYLPGGGWDLKIGAFTRSQSLRFTDPAPPASDPLLPEAPLATRAENSSYGFEARMNVATKGADLFTVGAEWVNDRLKDDADEDHAVERWSVYTQDQWRAGNWSAVGVLRRDEHSRHGGRVSPSLSVGWGSGGWKLWSAWANNFRAPSFEELYANGRYLQGDPDLKLETSDSFDGGIELGGGGGRVRLSAFRRNVHNQVAWADRDGDLVYQSENLSRVTVSGWEAQVLYRPSASIAIPVGYQRLSTRDEETNEQLPGAVRSLWRAAVQGTGKSLTWSLEYLATNRVDTGETRGFLNSTTFNAALAWRDTIASVPVQVSLRAENLQDRDYETVEGFPMRGRSWFAEVKVGL